MSRFLKLLLILMPICLSSVFLLALFGMPLSLKDVTYMGETEARSSVDRPAEVEPDLAPTVAATSTATPVPTNTPVPTDTPTPTVTATVVKTPVPSVAPTAEADPARGTIKQPERLPPSMTGKLFETLPPGTTLPSGDECANMVRRSTWEPRPENTAANHYIPEPGVDYTLEPWGGATDWANENILTRVDGRFVGTTDEILQWAACKWGIDEDILRAMAVAESTWYQSGVGDLGDSMGILQLRRSRQGTYPASALSTAWNADYVSAKTRACYEGHMRYLAKYNPEYAAGDIWGCLGVHNTGRWYNERGQHYIGRIQWILDQRLWEQPDF